MSNLLCYHWVFDVGLWLSGWDGALLCKQSRFNPCRCRAFCLCCKAILYNLRELVNLTHIQEVKLVQGNVYDLQEIFPLRSWFSSVIDGVYVLTHVQKVKLVQWNVYDLQELVSPCHQRVLTLNTCQTGQNGPSGVSSIFYPLFFLKLV